MDLQSPTNTFTLNSLFSSISIIYVFVLHPLLFPSEEGKTQTLNSECKIDLADFTDSVSFYHPTSRSKLALTQTLSKNT